MQNDILRAIDICHCVILLLLDLSTAFGSINHDIFLRRLNSKFVIYGTALDWLRSYLTDRKQSTLIKGKKKKNRSIVFSNAECRNALFSCPSCIYSTLHHWQTLYDTTRCNLTSTLPILSYIFLFQPTTTCN